jgi:hypothetical protein
MLARLEVKASVCPGCGHPKATAWHPDNEGFFEETMRVTCWACTAMKQESAADDSKPVEFVAFTDTRDYAAKPLPAVVRPKPTDQTRPGSELI